MLQLRGEHFGESQILEVDVKNVLTVLQACNQISIDIRKELLHHTQGTIGRDLAAEDVAITIDHGLALIDDCELLSGLTQAAMTRVRRIPQGLLTSAVDPLSRTGDERG
jgi:hypothetical protein